MKILKRSVREVYSKVQNVTVQFDTIAFTKIQKQFFLEFYCLNQIVPFWNS